MGRRRTGQLPIEQVLPVLVALGVKVSGEKMLLALTTGGAESSAAWQMLLEDLVARQVGRPRLILSDGNTGQRALLRHKQDEQL